MSRCEDFDYVIVGAGSAGCVLANRLSADPGVKVLVIEAGGRDTNPFIHMPAGFFQLLQSGKDSWQYQTAPQEHLDGRVLNDARGKVLGGSSSINGMCYSRGSPEIFDLWAQEGCEGWSHSDVLPWFKRAEANQTGDPRFHGHDGPLAVTRSSVTNPAQLAWLKAAQQAGFPYSDDHNGAAPEGFGPAEHTIYRGRRISTATAYLHPAIGRTNLTVRTGCRATSLILANGRAQGVTYLERGNLKQVFARREVILCGGTFQSPQLLMLSGVGEGEHLRSLGVRVAVDLPGVGQNLHDHVGTQVQMTCPEPVSDFAIATNPFRMALAGMQYLLSRKGPLASSGTDVIAYLRSGAPGHDELDLKFYLIPMLFNAGGGIQRQHGLTNLVILTRPESRGELQLRSADPLAPPVINANYLAESRDRDALRRGVRIAREIFTQPDFSSFRGSECVPGASVMRDEDLDAFFRKTCNVNYEAVGTCRIGVDDRAVVDPQLRVLGVEGLRIVDGSVMPRITTGDPNATIIMIAERAASMICGSSIG